MDDQQTGGPDLQREGSMDDQQTGGLDLQSEGSMDDQQTGGLDLQSEAEPEVFETALAPPLDLVASKLTDVGRARPHNEDYVEYYVPPDPELLARKGTLYLVADGMGGHQAGEVASRRAVELVIEHYYSDTNHDIGSSLVRAFHIANQEIHAQSQSDVSRSGMGTTLVAAVILGRQVQIANAGDSRAYLINRRRITQITIDHSWVEEQVRAGLLTPEQARRHPQRNLVTRALGSRPVVEVDLFEGEMGAGDTLLLCSDGLTGRVEDGEIARMVREHPPQDAARRLVALANERGGNDNISVLIVQAKEEPTIIRTPAVADSQKKPSPRTVIILALGVAAAILALLIGLLAWQFLQVGEPTVPPATPSVVPTTTSAPGVETTAPAATPSPSVLDSPLQPTSTLTPTPGPTPQAQATDAPASACNADGAAPAPMPSRPIPIPQGAICSAVGLSRVTLPGWVF